MAVPQSVIDALKKKYPTIEGVMGDPTRAKMGEDIRNAIRNMYGPAQGAQPNTNPPAIDPNIPDYLAGSTGGLPGTNQGGNTGNSGNGNTPASQAPMKFPAPNGKLYWLKPEGSGQYSFIKNDGSLFKGDLSTVVNFINENNKKEDTDYSTSTAQKNYNDKYAGGYGTEQYTQERVDKTVSRDPGDTTGWTQEDWDEFDWRTKVDSLNQSLQASFANLAGGNAEFKKLVDENLKAQLLKNQQMQEQLRIQKMETDSAFKLVEDKFSDQQKEAMKRIDEMETKWMDNFNQLQEQNKQYYEGQKSALDASLGGQQAGVASSLQAKGINEGVIGNALSQVKEQHMGRYNELLKNNMDIARTLNNDYLSFFKDVQGEREKWSTKELELFQQKFDNAKAIIGASKDAASNTINNAFKPIEDAMVKMTESYSTQAGFEATDNARIARYRQSDKEQRKVMLMAMLGLNASSLDYGAIPQYEITLLDKAVEQGELSDAIRMLGKAYQAIKASGGTVSPGPISNAIGNKIEQSSSSTEPTKTTDAPKDGAITPEQILESVGGNSSTTNKDSPKIGMSFDYTNVPLPEATGNNQQSGSSSLLDKDLMKAVTAIQNNRLQPMKDKAMSVAKIVSALKKERDDYIKSRKDGAGLVGKEIDLYRNKVNLYNSKIKELENHPIRKEILTRNTTR